MEHSDVSDSDDGGPGLPHEAVEARSEIARHLRPSSFPADRATLLSVAREENAPGAVLGALERLPDGAEVYENLQAVWAALGGPVEHGRA
ncbi:MAG TPA: DUF2795 domain-containing protein [Mycobacteriales bacterium]|nr:DUF2795 domain-containing protein [Mycobacteriales bacterium]